MNVEQKTELNIAEKILASTVVILGTYTLVRIIFVGVYHMIKDEEE